MIYDAYEVVKSETRTDAAGDYFYAAIACWENLADKQANSGQEFNFDGQVVKARLANDFKVRYAATGTRIVTRIHRGVEQGKTTTGGWLDLFDETRTEEPEWEREQFARDTSAEAIECVERYLARIANSAEYQAKIAAKPDRRGTTLNLQVASSDDGARETAAGTGFSRTYNELQVQSAPGYDQASRWFSGMRFASVTIPNAATIDGITVSVWPVIADDPRCEVVCEDVDDADDFATTTDVTSRTRTTGTESWIASNIGTGAFKSQSFSGTQVQEVVDRGGWSSGNALVLFMDGHTYTSYDGMLFDDYDRNSSHAPKLDIDYTAGGGGKTPIGPASQRIRMKRHGTYLRT